MSERIHEIETKSLALMQKLSSGSKVNKDSFNELHSLIKALHTSLIGSLSGANVKNNSSRKSEDPVVGLLEQALNAVDSVCKNLAEIVSNSEASSNAFRELHTMKGLASMNNLGALVDVIHKTEGTLDAICKSLSIAKAVGSEQRDLLLSELKSVRFIVEREIERKRKRFSNAA
jgi:HPt (histidine-containing phosphotransfer) domain-containing protein